MTDKFTKDTKLAEVLENEKLKEVLTKHNFPCVSCPMVKVEMSRLRIGQVCQMYGIDLTALLKDLNKI